MVERASRDHPRFKNELDAVVFMCKQFWMMAFNKNIDNLKTNHQVSHSFTPSIYLCLCVCVSAGYICASRQCIQTVTAHLGGHTVQR